MATLERRIATLEHRLAPDSGEIARGADQFCAKMTELISRVGPGEPITDREYAEWLIAFRTGQAETWHATWQHSHPHESAASWVARYFRQRGYTAFPRNYRVSLEVFNGDASGPHCKNKD